MTLPLPPAVLYVGLGGVLLSLVIATATNGWQPRVFVLLLLRLAIGWHFLFEGLHKLHSFTLADEEKAFTSARYFSAGDGPVAEMMRKKYIADPEKVYTERLAKKKPVTAAEFAKLSVAEQAELCPDAVAELLAAEDAAKALAAKAKYAAWVYGADKREAKVNLVTGDIPMSADQRLSVIAVVQRAFDELAAREDEGFGRGYGLETDRRKKLYTDLSKAKADLAADIEKFIAELRKDGGLPPLADKEKEIKGLDRLAAWGITAIGAGLLLGLLTKLWCVAGFGFLVTIYLSSPPWPWLPPQPPSEGNPLFINRNAIEALALLVILAHPTGKWLGLDALLTRLIFGPEKTAESPISPPSAAAAA